MQTRFYRWAISLLLAAVLIGCTANQPSGQPTGAGSPTGVSPTETLPGTSASISAPADAELSDQFNNLPRLQGEATVEMLVKGAPIVLQVRGADAPITAGNFVDLVNRGVYDGLVFHRVIREPQPFVAQGGDPQGKDQNFPIDRLGTGSFIDPQTNLPRYIPLEIKPEGASQPIYSKTFEEARITKPPVLRHTTGALAMARSAPPDSASAQFYITLADLTFLDGNYAVLGYVTSGMETVQQIQQGDRITSAKVTAGLENLRAGS